MLETNNISKINTTIQYTFQKPKRSNWHFNVEQQLYKAMHREYFPFDEQYSRETCYPLHNFQMFGINVKWDQHELVEFKFCFTKHWENDQIVFINEIYTKNKDLSTSCTRYITLPNGKTKRYMKITSFGNNNDWTPLYDAPDFGFDPWKN